MKKTPEYKSVTPAERRRLRRELKQMWSTVPPHALVKARELAGVEPGKEHEFRVALVKEQEGTQFIDYRVPVNLRVWLVDGLVKGQKAKLLKVQLNCGERAWQIEDGIYAKRFQSTEHLQKFLASIEKHVQLHLLESLRDTCSSGKRSLRLFLLRETKCVLPSRRKHIVLHPSHLGSKSQPGSENGF